MWCGFCGTYKPNATSEQCECEPRPLMEDED